MNLDSQWSSALPGLCGGAQVPHLGAQKQQKVSKSLLVNVLVDLPQQEPVSVLGGEVRTRMVEKSDHTRPSLQILAISVHLLVSPQRMYVLTVGMMMQAAR